MITSNPSSVVQESGNGGLYLGDSDEGKYIFEGRAKPTGMTDRLDMCCEENERVKDNSKDLDSADI